MYPEFIETAISEENKKAQWSFDVANKVEKIHAGLYSKTLDALTKGTQLASVDYYVCKVCGNTVEEMAPEKCPICGAPKAKFFKIA